MVTVSDIHEIHNFFFKTAQLLLMKLKSRQQLHVVFYVAKDQCKKLSKKRNLKAKKKFCSKTIIITTLNINEYVHGTCITICIKTTTK